MVIAEMLENPLQPRTIANSEVYLIEAIRIKGLKVKPLWEEFQDDDGRMVKKRTGWSDVIIPER